MVASRKALNWAAMVIYGNIDLKTGENNVTLSLSLFGRQAKTKKG